MYYIYIYVVILFWHIVCGHITLREFFWGMPPTYNIYYIYIYIISVQVTGTGVGTRNYSCCLAWDPKRVQS